MFIEQNQMIGQHLIDSTRAYCDYLEEHFNNIRRAFQELSEACDGMSWVRDDYTWHTIRNEVCWHDVSKFSTAEFVPYRDKFFPGTLTSSGDYPEFPEAWKHHYEHNEHHWEFIAALPEDTPVGTVECYLIHMVVDWMAMGYKFGDTAQQYYEANSHKVTLKPDQVDFIYELFNKLKEHQREFTYQ